MSSTISIERSRALPDDVPAAGALDELALADRRAEGAGRKR